jgi:hypothetical protein
LHRADLVVDQQQRGVIGGESFLGHGSGPLRWVSKKQKRRPTEVLEPPRLRGPDNDPHHEHDFGSFDYVGERLRGLLRNSTIRYTGIVSENGDF